MGESGSEWGKEYLRNFEKFGVRHPLSNTPLIVFKRSISPSKPFKVPRDLFKTDLV